MGKKDESDDERSEKHIRSEYMGDDDYRERSHYEKDKKGKTEKSLRKRIKDRINAVIHRKDIKQQEHQAEEEQWRQAASNRIMDFYVTYSDWDSLKKAVTGNFDEEMTTLGQEKRDKRARKDPFCETNELARRIDFARSLYESKVKEEEHAKTERQEREKAEQKERRLEECRMAIEREMNKLKKEAEKYANSLRDAAKQQLRTELYSKYLTETREMEPRMDFVQWSKRHQQERFDEIYRRRSARLARLQDNYTDDGTAQARVADPAMVARIKERFEACRSYTFGSWLLEWRKMLVEAQQGEDESREDKMRTLDELKLIMDSVKEEYEEWRREHVADADYTQNQWEDADLQDIIEAYDWWQ